jgi:hypothetical protein
MSDFRRAYSKLVMGVWDNPALEQQIQSNPSKLKDYGFTAVPGTVKFQASSGQSNVKGYDDQLTAYQAGGNVTFYIPPKPAGSSAAADDSYCCCCCPCCTCT